jgi:hypothetical protein
VIVPDPSEAITMEHFQIAKETLIRRKDTHLDSLAERLQETRGRAILESMLAGQSLVLTSDDDPDFLVDLGLLRRQNEPLQSFTAKRHIFRKRHKLR